MSSSRSLNISGSTAPVVDPEYRHKMPPVVCSPFTRGKTTVENMLDIAAALRRSPEELTKYFSCELGAQATYNRQQKTTTVRGLHRQSELQGLVHDYIDDFVLCPTCGLPETAFRVKNSVIRHKCAACGSRDALRCQDHKLCRFILANYKKTKQGSATASSMGARKSEEKALAKDKKAITDGHCQAKEDHLTRKEKKKSARAKHPEKAVAFENAALPKKQAKETKTSNKAGIDSDYVGVVGASSGRNDEADENEEGESDNEDSDQDDSNLAHGWRGRWAVIPGESKRETRLRSRVYVTDETLVKIDGMRLYLRHNSNANPTELLEKIVAGRRSTKADNATWYYYPLDVHILVRSALWVENMVQIKAISRYATVLQQVTHKNGGGDGIAATLLQRHLIGALEVVCREKPKSFAIGMLQLYECDVLDEDTVMEWYGDRHGRSVFTTNDVTDLDRRAIYKSTEPFVRWLQEADEEEDEEDEEEAEEADDDED